MPQRVQPTLSSSGYNANGNEEALKEEQLKEIRRAESIDKRFLFCINLELPCTYLADITLLIALFLKAHKSMFAINITWRYWETY